MSQALTIERLAMKVREMREAQRNYFQQRSPGWLSESKKLEKEVDDLLKQVPEPPKPEQTSLF